MMPRRQPPAYSPITPGDLAAGAMAVVRGGREPLRGLSAMLRERYGTPRLALTDCGTSALVLALRIVARRTRVVAIPGYACVDIVAAARRAHVRVRVYDVDPVTLSPDRESLEATVRRGVDAVVVAHLFGYPCDLGAIAAIADRHGVPIIEDAAQAAGGVYRKRPLGSFGALSVLSFGRGKGVTGGHGGALLINDPRHDDAASELVARLGGPRRGAADVAAAAAQYVFGRPALYAVPSRLPWLHLGETIYHDAHEPRSMSVAAAAVVRRALRQAPGELTVRARAASVLAKVVEEGGDIAGIVVGEDAEPGFLRFPVVDSGNRVPRPDLGILRGYPRVLTEEPEAAPILLGGDGSLAGAKILCRSLFTLPTHRLVRRADLEAMVDWLRVPTRVMVPPPVGQHAASA